MNLLKLLNINKPLIIILTNDLLPNNLIINNKKIKIMNIINNKDINKIIKTINKTKETIIIQNNTKLIKKYLPLLNTPYLFYYLTLQEKKQLLKQLNININNNKQLLKSTIKSLYLLKQQQLINIINDTNDINDKNKNDYEMLKQLMGENIMRTRELKKLLTTKGLISSIRTADRRINDWLEEGILLRVSQEERNYQVKLNPNY